MISKPKKGFGKSLMNNKIKVVYIMGWGRSGSTILANILGQIEGFLSIGEIRMIWEDGFIRNVVCECGKPFFTCDYWQHVVDEFSKRVDRIQAERWNRLFYKETRTRNAPKFLFPRDSFPLPPDLQEYLSITEKFYEALWETSGGRILVDSSKCPFYGNILWLIPQIEVYTIHLVRDPRAVAYSWSVRKPQPDIPLHQINAVNSSILWTVWNVAAEWFRRQIPGCFLRIRYEDFMLRPRATVDKILGLVGEYPSALPFLTDSSVLLGPNHTLRGNPCRYETGKIDLSEDLRWKTRMKRGNRWVTEILTWPLALRYGYSIAHPQSSPPHGANR